MKKTMTIIISILVFIYVCIWGIILFLGNRPAAEPAQSIAPEQSEENIHVIEPSVTVENEESSLEVAPEQEDITPESQDSPVESENSEEQIINDQLPEPEEQADILSEITPSEKEF